jgi:outer membrane lipoprotein-sorting protein
MKRITFVLIILPLLLVASKGLAVDPKQIVKKGDEVVNAPKDAHILSTMILIDRDGNRNTRTSEMYQIGSTKRLVQFLTPADQKGIGFLSLPDDVMYLYLPAFHKVRQIASHVKNQEFAGTDLTYEDLSEFELSKAHRVELVEETDEVWVVKLYPNDIEGKDYTHLHVHYRKDNNYPVTVEFYDESGSVWKTIERKKIEKVSGYWVARELEVKNFKKNHSTISTLDKVEFDLGLGDDIFTKRYLMRTR